MKFLNVKGVRSLYPDTRRPADTLIPEFKSRHTFCLLA